MNPSDDSRRNFLRQALCWVALGGVAGCRSLPQAEFAANVMPAAWLDDVIGNLDAASRIGKRYLAAHPEEQSADQILGAIAATVQGRLDFDGVSAAIKSDYVRGETVLVDGWIISRSEARVYALAALGRGEI